MQWTYNNKYNVDNQATWIVRHGRSAWVFIPSVNATTRSARYQCWYAISGLDQLTRSDEFVDLYGCLGKVTLTDVTGENTATRRVGFDELNERY